MLDVSRHFISIDYLKQNLDMLASLKMNKFHWHLTDDQGWRIEIKSWPDLAKIGGSSAIDGDPGGYYTQDQYAEIVAYAQEVLEYEKTHPMHIGGGYDFPFGRVKMTPALHGGQVAGKGAEGYTTVPAGLLLSLDGCGIYHAGDTALTTDMTLLEGQVDVALLPIGDNFTMGPEDAARAVDMIKPRVVIPIHYDTWPLIGQDPESFRARVEPRAEVVVLKPGDVYEF